MGDIHKVGSANTISPHKSMRFDGMRKSLLLVAAALVAVFAVSGQSLWIDEAYTAGKACASSPAIWWQEMTLHKGSDQQMPLYMAAIWAWEKLSGSSEFALRAFNIPLFLIAIAAILLLLNHPPIESEILALVTICSPILWVYLDEARPYILQFLGSTLLFIALVNLVAGYGRPLYRDLLQGLSGALLLSGASLTGVIFTIFYGLAFLILWQRREPILMLFGRPAAVLALSGSGILMAGLAAYYWWTLKVGAGASSIGTTSPATVAFSLYELFGAAGWGPGRTALRETGVVALRAYLPGLALFLLASGVFAAAGIAALRDKFTFRWAAALPIAAAFAGAVTIVCLGLVMDFRVLGRHLIPVLPALLFLMSQVLVAIWQSGRPLLKAAGVFYLIILFISCLSLRLSPRFAKDAYREAAGLASLVSARGGSIWWAADPMGAVYYGLTPVLAGESGCVFLANNRSATYLSNLPEPEIVVLSKPDIYDPNATLSTFLLANSYQVSERFPSMTVWRQHPLQVEPMQ